MKMRSRTSVSERHLGEWHRHFKKWAPQAPRALRAHHPCTMVGRAGRGKFWMSTAFSNKKMASPRRHTAFRRTAEFASRTCCLPIYVHCQNGGSNAAQGSASCAQTKSICTKVGRQCQNHVPVVSEFCALKRCEREQSHTNTVARYGTHGGPPGRMTLVQ